MSWDFGPCPVCGGDVEMILRDPLPDLVLRTDVIKEEPRLRVAPCMHSVDGYFQRDNGPIEFVAPDALVWTERDIAVKTLVRIAEQLAARA